VFLYAFDLLELNGEDYRREPLEKRKATLERLLAGRTGVRLSEHIEGDGPIIFEHACKMGLEGIVSKRSDMPYRSERFTTILQLMRREDAWRLICPPNENRARLTAAPCSRQSTRHLAQPHPNVGAEVGSWGRAMISPSRTTRLRSRRSNA
jgi:hypothetical protein